MANIAMCTFTVRFKDDSVVTVNAVDLTTALNFALSGRTGDQAVVKSVVMDKEGIQTVIPAGTYS